MSAERPADLSSFYDEVRALETVLRHEGSLDDADALDRAISGGSTSGEILAHLGVALDRISSTRPDHGADTKRLLAFVDSALGPRR